MNSEVCPHCGDVVYLDQKVEWIDKDKKIAKCPEGEFKIIAEFIDVI